MTDIDKFLLDADRLVARASASGTTDAKRLAADLSNAFRSWTRDYGEIGESLAAYWVDEYSDTLRSTEGRTNAVTWFGSVLALLSGCFEDGMDFPDRDWEEIRDTVSSEADSLDMEIISSIMTVIVERGKAE
jgi:hypothetical protein